MRILITGANGYIGRSLYNALKDKHDITAITRQDFDLTKAKPTELFFSSRWPFDLVIHCAASGVNKVKESDWNIMDENLLMYYNLLNFKHCYGKLIHFGSGAETYMPKEPYGYSKKVIAKSILNQENFYNLKLFGVFDENELDTRFIKGNIKRYINKEPLQVHENKLMDFFYMQDLVKVVEYYINEKDPPKEFDCVYKDNYAFELGFIAAIINALDDYRVDIIKPSHSIQTESYISNYRTDLPIDFIGLEEGIKRTYCKLKQEKL